MAPNQNGPPIQPARDEDSSLVQRPADQIFVSSLKKIDHEVNSYQTERSAFE